jgi:hypothetical protein
MASGAMADAAMGPAGALRGPSIPLRNESRDTEPSLAGSAAVKWALIFSEGNLACRPTHGVGRHLDVGFAEGGLGLTQTARELPAGQEAIVVCVVLLEICVHSR